MKKWASFVVVFLAAILIHSSTAYAASYFSHNKALNSIFKTLEKEFQSYGKDEVIPQKYYELVLTEEDKKNIKPSPTKKITDSQKKVAAEKKLNEIKAAIEIKEEELGGLTSKDYKTIEEHLKHILALAKGSEYGWDIGAKKVSLYLNIHEDDLTKFNGLVGNYASLGKEKDQVDLKSLQVKSKITRYINQSIQKGNKVSQEVQKKLPGEVEKLFINSELSKIEAARVLAEIHAEIFSPDYATTGATHYNGDESIESIIESYEYSIKWVRYYREEEKKREYFEFPKDVPSNPFKDYITEQIIREELTESFTSGFNKAVTLDDLAKLYFETKELDDKIVIESGVIKADSPDYIKNAFIYGMIDDEKSLYNSLTRLEATRYLVNGAAYERGITTSLRVVDNDKIPIADQLNVSTCINAGMKTRIDKFEAKSKYTKEEAIMDQDTFEFEYIRGFNIPISLYDPSKVIVGKDTIHLLFENNKEITEYMNDYLDNTVLSKIKLTGKYTKIDTGGALIELYTPEKGIKFTIKKGVNYIDFEQGRYGPDLCYKIEPKVIKSTDKVNMNLQPDSIYKKLNAKLDVILSKIIKPKMTEEQKVKAIHDFVVKHITYDSKLQDEMTIESVIYTIDKGRGVCGDYSLLFLHLCNRVNIPVVYEAGSEFTLNHAWNAVYLNGKWLFVDTTWADDDSGKIKYTYYLKDKYTFMKSHTPFMGVPDKDVYTNIDNMKIKNQDELRGYLLQNVYWVDGYQLTFRMADKNMKPSIGYMRDTDVRAELKYDSKKDIYTVIMKAKK